MDTNILLFIIKSLKNKLKTTTILYEVFVVIMLILPTYLNNDTQRRLVVSSHSILRFHYS